MFQQVICTNNQSDALSCICYDETRDGIIISDVENHYLQLFDSETYKSQSFIGHYGSDICEFHYPKGLCIQPFTNHLLVCDSLNSRIQILGNDVLGYSFLYEIVNLFNSPVGICCDKQGCMFITDDWNHKIHHHNEYGRYLDSFGCFEHPSSVTIENNQLYVADTNNQRVSIWSCDSSNQSKPIHILPIHKYCYSVCVNPMFTNQLYIGTTNDIIEYDCRNYNQVLDVIKLNKTETSTLDLVTGLCIHKQKQCLMAVTHRTNKVLVYKLKQF